MVEPIVCPSHCHFVSAAQFKCKEGNKIEKASIDQTVGIVVRIPCDQGHKD